MAWSYRVRVKRPVWAEIMGELTTEYTDYAYNGDVQRRLFLSGTSNCTVAVALSLIKSATYLLPTPPEISSISILGAEEWEASNYYIGVIPSPPPGYYLCFLADTVYYFITIGLPSCT